MENVVVNSRSCQTDSVEFCLEIVNTLKEKILEHLEKEKALMNKTNYELLVQKALEVVSRLRTSVLGGDVFFRGGQFSAACVVAKPLEDQAVVKMDMGESWETSKVVVRQRAGGAGRFYLEPKGVSRKA